MADSDGGAAPAPDVAPTCTCYVPFNAGPCGFLAKWRAGDQYACDAHAWLLRDPVELPDADLLRIASRLHPHHPRRARGDA